MSDLLKSKLPIAVVASLLGTALGVGGMWSSARAQAEDLAARLGRQEQRSEQDQRERERARVEIELLKQAVGNLTEMTREIRQDVKDLKRGGR